MAMSRHPIPGQYRNLLIVSKPSENVTKLKSVEQHQEIKITFMMKLGTD
jgi:hypothetical protein